MRKQPQFEPRLIFVAPPSLDDLKIRLSGRGTDSDDAIANRLRIALDEIAYAQSGAFHQVVVNDDVDRAYGVLKELIVEGKGDGDGFPESLKAEKS